MSKKISTCPNHLPELYKALQSGNIARLTELEHELTDEEKCVACSYLFKSKGSARGAFEHFLKNEGFDVTLHEKSASKNIAKHWILRLALLSTIFLAVSIIITVIKNFLLGMNVPLISFTILELTLVGVISCVIFLFVDDLLIE